MTNETSSELARPRRKVLGRGLGALLESRTAAVAEPPVPVAFPPAGSGDPEPNLRHIVLDAIEPNPNQPRKKFPAESLEELADSIRAHGLLQPIIVTPLARFGAPVRYQLVAGERRWRAAQLAGLRTVPALVQETRKNESLELALIENLQREDLNPIEAAAAFQRLAQEFGLKHEEIAQRTGKDRATITNLLRLLRLPPEVQQLLAEGKLSAGHAKALLALDSAQDQRRLATYVVERGLSVRDIEKLVARDKQAPAKKQAREKHWDANIRAALQDLERVLGTRVHLLGTPRKGKLQIEYYSQEDLMRIYDLILKS